MTYEVVEHISKSPFFIKADEKKEPKVFTVDSLDDIKNLDIVKDKTKDKSWYKLSSHLYKKDEVEIFYLIIEYRKQNHPEEFTDSKVYKYWDILASVTCSHDEAMGAFPVFTMEEDEELLKSIAHIKLTPEEINRRSHEFGHINGFFNS